MSKTLSELKKSLIAASKKTVDELIAFADEAIPAKDIEENDIQYARRLQLVSSAKQKAAFDAFKLLDKIKDQEGTSSETEPTTKPGEPAKEVDFDSPEKRTT